MLKDKLLVGSVALVFLIILVFGQTFRFGMISLDDVYYITDNKMLWTARPLEFITWSFGSSYQSVWAPLVWCSYYLDGFLYSTTSGFHLTNVILHALSSLLVYRFFLKATNEWVPSFILSCVFAIHPLQVEAVTWLSGRKDCLSSVFFFITLNFYQSYCSSGKTLYYYFGVFTFILSLLAKQMAVTLPFVLVLIEVWPLHRVILPAEMRGVFLSIIESLWKKKAFLIVAVIASLAPIWAHYFNHTISSENTLSFIDRLILIPAFYLHYIKSFFYPVGLTLHPIAEIGQVPMAVSILGLVILLTASATTLYFYKIKPCYAVGWFWFVGTLVPVIGIIPFGAFPIGDRYMYLPIIGIAIIMAWGLFSIKFWISRKIVYSGAILIPTILISLAIKQVSVWRNDTSLWEYSLRVNPNSLFFNERLVYAFLVAKEYSKAIKFLEDLKIEKSVGLLTFYGRALVETHQLDKGIAKFEEASRLDPNYFYAVKRLGNALLQNQEYGRAIEVLNRALNLLPHQDSTERNLVLYYLSLAYIESNQIENLVSLIALYKPQSIEVKISECRKQSNLEDCRRLVKDLFVLP